MAGLVSSFLRSHWLCTVLSCPMLHEIFVLLRGGIPTWPVRRSAHPLTALKAPGRQREFKESSTIRSLLHSRASTLHLICTPLEFTDSYIYDSVAQP